MSDFHWSFPLLIGFVLCLFIQSYGTSYGQPEAFQLFLQKKQKKYSSNSPNSS